MAFFVFEILGAVRQNGINFDNWEWIKPFEIRYFDNFPLLHVPFGAI